MYFILALYTDIVLLHYIVMEFTLYSNEIQSVCVIFVNCKIRMKANPCVKIESFDGTAHSVYKHVICDFELYISFTLKLIMSLVFY